MNTKTTTLGIGAAIIGGFAALVGALVAGKNLSRAISDAGADRAQTPHPGQAVAGITPQLAGTPGTVAATDGPSGPTAHGQPAPTGDEGHAVPDLAATAPLGPDHRAPVAFRPDMDAPMTAAEREALRPATGPSPSLVSDEGSSIQGSGGNLV